MKKWLLFIIDSLTCGGAEKSLVSLLPLLSREKYDIYLWARVPNGSFLPLVSKDVHLVETPRYNLIEKVLLKIAGIWFSIYLRIQKVVGIKEHGAETEWKCKGWAMKVPEGKWEAVFAYQQGVPTYMVATHFPQAKKFAWVNADIFKAGRRQQELVANAPETDVYIAGSDQIWNTLMHAPFVRKHRWHC